MATRMQHSVEIGRPAEQVYEFITQPWRWHEWHPSSESAQASASRLAVGDGFDEVIRVQPLAPWPPVLRRATRYQVQAAQPGRHWCCRGQMQDGWLEIRYELESLGERSRLTRTLTFEVQGITRCLLPLLRFRQQRLSAVALDNLKALLEAR